MRNLGRTAVAMLLLSSMMAMVHCQELESCYAGKLNISTSLPYCSGNERSYSLRNATFYCSGNPIHCSIDQPLACRYIYTPIRVVSSSSTPTSVPSPSSAPSPLPGVTSLSTPLHSATPVCSAVIRNLTDTYCRPGCCSDLACEPLVRDTNGLVVNLTDSQIVRHGLLNNKHSTYNYSMDGPGGEIYRPRCQCEVKGNFLYKFPGCISSIGTFPRNRPFLECTLCHECYETEFEANLAASSSSAFTIETPDGTRFCPQKDGTDPVGCFAGDELDRVCLDNYHSGLDVNGDALFCSENQCNLRSLCNCSYVDFHEECLLENGDRAFRTTLPILQKNSIFPKSAVSSGQIPVPRVTFDGTYLMVDATEPFNLKLSYKGRHYNLKAQSTSNYDLRKMIPPGSFSVSHSGSGSTFNFYLQQKEENSHRTLGIVMFSLSMVLPVMLLFYGLYLCLPKTASCVRRTPLVQKLTSGGGKVLDQFLPMKMTLTQGTLISLFLGVGLIECSMQMTSNKLIIGSSYSTVILDDCLSIKQYSMNEFLVVDRPNVDCTLKLSHYNGTSIVHEESLETSSWVDCRVRSPFVENLEDTLSCSSALTTSLVVIVIILAILLCCVLMPSFVKVCLIVMAFTVPASACDYSQSLTSSSVNCVNTPSGQNCTLTGTFSSYLQLSQTFCVGTKNSFGVPGTSLSIEYANSTESLQLKTVGYTQAFEQTYFSKDRCNDCLFTCNGDCSSEQCLLIGGFGVNPNGQNTDNSVLGCPSYSGCDLIQDDVSESWVSGCLLKPNCHWWQYNSCGHGEVSALSSIFSSRVGSGLVLRSGNSTLLMKTTQKQPVLFAGFLVSTSTQVNPVDFKSLGYDTLVKKSGSAFLCRTSGFDSSRRESLGDYFCVEPTCTYKGPESIRIPDDVCEHETLGSDSLFSCHKSFYSELETQSTCRKLPFTTEAGLLYFQDDQLLMDLSQSSEIEVRVSVINSTFEFTSDLIKPELSVSNCSGFVDYSGSSSCHLKGDCKPYGLVSLSTSSSSVILSQDSSYCSDGLDFSFSVFEEDVDFDLLIGNRIFNQTLKIKFQAQNYTGSIQEEEPVKKVEDEGWEPFDSWEKIISGLGNIWDWIIVIVETFLVLAVLALILYIFVRTAICMLPAITSMMRKLKVNRAKKEKDPESQERPKTVTRNSLKEQTRREFL